MVPLSTALCTLGLLYASRASAQTTFAPVIATTKADVVAMTQANSAVKSLAGKKQFTQAEADTFTQLFYSWAAYYGYSFPKNTIETDTAMYNFKVNMQNVYSINSNSSILWWASGGPNSHLSFSDFKSKYLMTNFTSSITRTGSTMGAFTSSATSSRKLHGIPSDVNWVTAGIVPPVRDQKQCGSCWTFSATGVLEMSYLQNVGGISPSQIHFSEEEFVQCCNRARGCTSQGCQGGQADEAINFNAKYGQSTYARWPYTSGGGTTGTCNTGLMTFTSGGGVQVSGSAKLVTPTNNKAALMAAIAVAPTTVYFDVENSFMSYSGGVYTGANGAGCGSQTNHAMVLVGYSTSGSKPYWLIRNSWGSSWGESGYIRVAMTENGIGLCGMYQENYQAPRTWVKTLGGGPGPASSPIPTKRPPPTRSPPPAKSPPKPPPLRSPPPNKRSPPPNKRSPPSRRSSPPPAGYYYDGYYYYYDSSTPSTSSDCTCQFPFSYHGQSYSACTTAGGSSTAWCIVPDSCASSDGTIYTSGGLSAGQKYKYCTGPPSPAKRPPPSSACQCTFPFTYKGKQYSSCTTADDTSPWCMVSSACSNYMGHIGSQKWLYC